MKSIGLFCIFMGVLAIIFGLFNYPSKLFYPIYQWGSAAAWGIKLGTVALGVAIYLVGSKCCKKESKKGT